MSIDTIWVPVIAALGSAALTGLVAFGLDFWRSRRMAAAALAERRAHAYSALIARAGVIAHTASFLHLSMSVRSGLVEGVDVLLGKRRLLDPFEVMEQFRRDTEPLYDAWSAVWTTGSKPAIRCANEVVDKCGAVMSAATQRGEGRTALMRSVAGEKWTQEQLDQWQNAVRELADARRRLAEMARNELGLDVAELFLTK